MKTIFTHLNINNHGFKQSISRKKSYRNSRYEQNTNKASGDINRNSTVSQAEYERDACEQELYRLRYGIEKLLADNDQGDFTQRQRQRFRPMENSSRTMTDFNNKENQSWIERCADCYRRGRRDIYDDNADLRNEYSSYRMYNDHNYDSHSRRIPQTPIQPSVYSESFASPSRTPSRSPSYNNPNMINDMDNGLRRSIDSLVNRNIPDGRDITNFLTSKGLNDPVYNSLIVKILEAKALDCLCTGYSKQNTQKQISQALAQLNQRTNEHPWDSVSATSSRSPSVSYESSPSDSSYLTEDESTSSSSIISQSDSPSPSTIYTPNTIPSLVSPDNNKDFLKVHDDTQTPKKQSKVTIIEDDISQSDQSEKKKKSSSKHPKKSSSKHRKPSSSKHRTKSSTTTKKPHKSTKSHKHHSTSKSKTQKGSSRSPSKSKTSKKQTSKHHKSSKKKHTKGKSNNQINDYESIKSPTFICPQSYQHVYKTRQQLLKLLLTST